MMFTEPTGDAILWHKDRDRVVAIAMPVLPNGVTYTDIDVILVEKVANKWEESNEDIHMIWVPSPTIPNHILLRIRPLDYTQPPPAKIYGLWIKAKRSDQGFEISTHYLHVSSSTSP